MQTNQEKKSIIEGDDEQNIRLAHVMTIKKHIYSFIDQKKLIEFLLFLIDKSEVIKFEVASDRKFINLRNLSISLVLNVKAAEKKYGTEYLYDNTNDPNSRDIIINSRVSLIRQLIVEPFVELINNLLGTIIKRELKVDYPYGEWIEKILPENKESLINSVNNFVEYSEVDKVRMQKDFEFLLSMCSAYVFPPDDININIDTGFTLEILV